MEQMNIAAELPAPPQTSRRWNAVRLTAARGWPVPFLLLILWGWIWVQATTFTPAHGEADLDGYATLARRLASLGPIGVVDADPFRNQNHVWVENARGEVLPKYAPGYPLLMAAFYLVGGDTAMFLVSPVFGGLALIGAFLLFRRWSNDAVALVAAAIFAANPIYLFYSGYLLAHAPEVCFTIWGMYFLWRWLDGPDRMPQTPPTSDSGSGSRIGQVRTRFHCLRGWIAVANREHSLDGLFAGLLLGYAVTIRHTAATLALCIAVAMVAKIITGVRERRLPLKPLAALGCAYAIFPLLLMAYNWRFFGSPFETGYGLTGEQFSFSREHLVENLPPLISGLNSGMMPAILSVGLVGILATGTLVERWIKCLWFFPVLMIYGSYYWGGAGMSYYRFLFPSLPLFIGAAFALIWSLRCSGLVRALAVAGLAGLALMLQLDEFRNRVGIDLLAPLRAQSLTGATLHPQAPFDTQPAAMAVVRATRVAEATLRDDAVIFAADQMQYHLGTRRHFVLYTLASFHQRYGNQFRGPLTQGILMQPVRRQRAYEFYQRNNDAQLKVRQEELIRQSLAANRQVVCLIPQSQLPQLRQRFAPNWQLNVMKEWDEPQWATKNGVTWGIYQVVDKAAVAEDRL
jgi:4-amino-4-deoxy-L-arabinose transferase-like glycosyltransferase